MRTIIWDWNGTLLDDVDACVRSMNLMLEKRKLQTIDFEAYRNVFTFPVIDYYKAVGFDLNHEKFDELADEYIALYRNNSQESPLQKGAIDALRHFQTLGCRQIVLSAMESESLRAQIGARGILDFFDDVIGLDNIQAHGKIAIALEYFKSREDPANMLLIGDTRHDYEVAAALGCRCVLVKNGHQNLDRFRLSPDTPHAESLSDVPALVLT